MSIQTLKDEIARRFGTPAVVVDLDVVERNIARVQALCDAAGIANRPHIKTHKSPAIAAMQRAAGARGITCQKIGEAEVMADAGHDDILISYNILGEQKVSRLGALLSRVNVTVAADNPTVVAGLPRAAEIAGREAGLEPRIVSSGGTPNLRNLGRISGITEHRAGTYVFNDRMMMAAGVAT